MKKLSLLLLLFAFIFQSCKKDADEWVGTYNGQTGQSIQRVLINKVDKNTLKIELQTVLNNIYYTYAIIQSAKIVDANSANVDEDGQLARDPALYRFRGSLTKSGKNITIAGNATNKNNSADVKNYYFNGSK